MIHNETGARISPPQIPHKEPKIWRFPPKTSKFGSIQLNIHARFKRPLIPRSRRVQTPGAVNTDLRSIQKKPRLNDTEVVGQPVTASFDTNALAAAVYNTLCAKPPPAWFLGNTGGSLPLDYQSMMIALSRVTEGKSLPIAVFTTPRTRGIGEQKTAFHLQPRQHSKAAIQDSRRGRAPDELGGKMAGHFAGS